MQQEAREELTEEEIVSVQWSKFLEDINSEELDNT